MQNENGTDKMMGCSQLRLYYTVNPAQRSYIFYTQTWHCQLEDCGEIEKVALIKHPRLDDPILANTVVASHHCGWQEIAD